MLYSTCPFNSDSDDTKWWLMWNTISRIISCDTSALLVRPIRKQIILYGCWTNSILCERPNAPRDVFYSVTISRAKIEVRTKHIWGNHKHTPSFQQLYFRLLRFACDIYSTASIDSNKNKMKVKEETDINPLNLPRYKSRI